MRIELRDGQWADLRERITHAQDKELKVAWRKGKEDDVAWAEVDTVLVRVFVMAWSVKDPDGKSIDLADADAIDRAPDDIIDTLAVKAGELWTGATVPNAPTPS